MITIREYTEQDLPSMVKIWNEIVSEGNAFPQDVELDLDQAREFFASQTYCGVAETDKLVGLYVLHPNNVGHCGHICNASFAVSAEERGKSIGEFLVRHCIYIAPKFGFHILQFNAVLSSNTPAINLYDKLGFERIGQVKNGYAFADGSYGDITLFYKNLDEKVGCSSCKNRQ